MGSGAEDAQRRARPRGLSLAPSRTMEILRDVFEDRVRQSGKVGYALLWLLGVPLPILLIVYAVRGCN